MYGNHKVVVIMPAYNAAATLRRTHDEVMAQGIVDLVIVVDDASHDDTTAIARTLPQTIVHTHVENRGYGGNQKTCYQRALGQGADIVVMIHPDYQYTPQLIPAMASMIGNGLYKCVLGSRILGGYALDGGMPRWKYIANRFLTFALNVAYGAKLSEYHTGYRAFSRDLLQSLPLEANSDDFVFDNQILAEILWQGHTIAEVSCPTKYFAEASSINFRRSVEYGFGCLATALEYRLAKTRTISSRRFASGQAGPRPSCGTGVPPVSSPPNHTGDGDYALEFPIVVPRPANSVAEPAFVAQVPASLIGGFLPAGHIPCPE